MRSSAAVGAANTQDERVNVTGSGYRPSAIDGLPARISGQWAKEKLKYLDKYMYLFNVGMKNRWHKRVFLDLLAGCGKCVDKDTSEEFDGSPLRAIQCDEPFTRVICVESDSGLADALEQRTTDKAVVIRDDCNNPKAIEQLRASLGYGILGLAFIDNLGLDVPLSTIASLTDGRLLDLFIVFQIGDIKRNIRDVLAGRDEPTRFDRFFGAGWTDVATKAERENLTADETTTRLLDFYADKLKGLGYDHIAHSRRVMKNSTGVGLYRLILAGRHERAVDFFNKVSAIDPWGQRDFGF
jgi:three-Cys-motif partner protein